MGPADWHDERSWVGVEETRMGGTALFKRGGPELSCPYFWAGLQLKGSLEFGGRWALGMWGQGKGWRIRVVKSGELAAA